jgi:hypothetical protein
MNGQIEFGDVDAFKKSKSLFDSHKPKEVVNMSPKDIKLPPYHFFQKYAQHLITSNRDEHSQMLGWAIYQESSKDVNEFLRLIEIDKSIINLIESTDNDHFYRPLFFPKVFINTDIHYENFIIKGLLLIDENNPKNDKSIITKKEDILMMAVGYDMDESTEYMVFTELVDKPLKSVNQYGVLYKDKSDIKIVDKLSNHLRNVACNLIDLVMGNADTDVNIIEIETTKEQNLKRVKRGQIQIPTKVFIKPKDHFLKYLTEFNTEHDKSHLTHKFLVRGFWRHFRSERYTKMRGKSVYTYPFYKGGGILIAKDYKITA